MKRGPEDPTDTQTATAADSEAAGGDKRDLPPLLKKRLLARGIKVNTNGVSEDARNSAEEPSLSPSDASPPLPSGWKETLDAKYRKPYYYNATLGISSWVRPTEQAAKKEVKAEEDPLPPGWKSALDPQTGRTYYCNPFTSVTSWDRPVDAAIVANMKRCRGCGGFGRGLVHAHGFCLHCSRILHKPIPGQRVPEAVKPPPKQKPPSVVVVAKRPGIYVDSPGIGPSSLSNRPIAKVANPVPSSRAQVAQRAARKAASGGIDPMDPASYSDAPVGGWGAGMEINKTTITGGGSRPLPSPGDVLRQNAEGNKSAGPTSREDQKAGLGEAD